MGKVVAFLNITLDGVIQGPAGPEEDTRNGFTGGGWAAPYAAMQEANTGSMASTGALLFGRWTYESFYAFWPHQTNNPFTEILNNTPKYVASTTLKGPLPWQNSILLDSHIANRIAQIKQEAEKDITILGSGALVRSLLNHPGVIDEMILLIHPLVLRSGQRLFAEDGTAINLELVDSMTTSKGVVAATYRLTP